MDATNHESSLAKQAIDLRPLGPADLASLMPLVERYHEFEGIVKPDNERREALMPLLQTPQYGVIYAIEQDTVAVGYMALAYGYSIEFGGREAVVDEFFIEPAQRGRGLGRYVLDLVVKKLSEARFVALNLEVAHQNSGAKSLYERKGFKRRTKYDFMTLEPLAKGSL